MATLLLMKDRCLAVLLAFTVASVNIYAQCTGCSTLVTTSTGANYTINAGQSLCVNASATLTGQVFLNGGTLCNSGTVNNLKLNGGRGIVKNYNIVKNIEATIAFAGNLSVYAYAASQITFTSTAINMGSIDSLFFNVYNGGKVVFSSDLSISSRVLNVYNGITDPAAPSNTTVAYFNVGSNLNINNATFKLYNSPTGIVNVSGSTNLSNTRNKTIINNGIVNLLNSFNISGTGSENKILINNNKTFNVSNSMDCSITAADVIFNNNIVGSSFALIGQNLSLSDTRHIISNKEDFKVSGNMTVSKGVVTNYKTLTCNINMSLSQGAVLNNYSVMKVLNSFTNTATMNLGFSSYTRLKDYYNLSTGMINGSTDATDVSEYAKMLISGSSRNDAVINGKVLVYDQSLVSSSANGNINYGFDIVNNPSNISSDAQYAAKGVAPGTGNPPGINCNLLGKFYSKLAVQSTGGPICQGACITLSPGFFNQFGFNNSYTDPVPLSNFLWSPGGSTASSINVCPSATQTYTFSTTIAGCVLTAQITIVVNSNLSVSISPNILYYFPDVSYSASSTVPFISGGTAPYTCVWIDSNTNSTISTACTNNFQPVNGNGDLILTATDANGCKGTGTLKRRVVDNQYAELSRSYDGSYYLMTNNKLYFKYTGQYISTNLNYKIYDNNRNQVSCPAMVQNLGDNRFVIDFNQCGYPASGFFALEVTNEKNEITYLKFMK